MILLIRHGFLCLRWLLETKTYPLKSNLFRIASQLVSSSFYPLLVQIIMYALTLAEASLILLRTLDLSFDSPITRVLLYLIQMSAWTQACLQSPHLTCLWTRYSLESYKSKTRRHVKLQYLLGSFKYFSSKQWLYILSSVESRRGCSRSDLLWLEVSFCVEFPNLALCLDYHAGLYEIMNICYWVSVSS